eukprot:7448134-Pyramimonas_sp.AAC.1
MALCDVLCDELGAPTTTATNLVASTSTFCPSPPGSQIGSRGRHGLLRDRTSRGPPVAFGDTFDHKIVSSSAIIWMLRAIMRMLRAIMWIFAAVTQGWCRLSCYTLDISCLSLVLSSVYPSSLGVDCRPGMWQFVDMEYTSNIWWNIRNAVR